MTSLFRGSRVIGSQNRQLASKSLFAKAILAGTCLSTALILSGTVSVAQTATKAEEEAESQALAAQAANGGIILNPIVVTASSIATSAKDAPASVSVLSQEKLQQRATPDISEALRTVPGVNVGFGSDGTRGISIRGMGSGYTLILIDGKRINAGLTTLRHYNGDLNWVPVDAIERIEIVRGPMSTLYGSDALGGVVNIITKKSADTWTGSLTTEWIQPESNATGSTKKISAYVSGPIVPNELAFTAYGSIGRQKPSNPSEHDDIQTPGGIDDYDYTAKLSWTPTANQLFEIEGSTGKEKYRPYLGDGAIDTSKTSIRRTTGSLRHVGEWDFGTSTITAFIENADNHHNTTDRLGVVTGDTTINVKSYSLDGKLSMPVDFWFEQDLTIGGEVRREEMSDPENLGKPNSVTGTTGSTDTSMWAAAVFVEDQIKLRDDLKLTTGLRIDQHEEFGTHASPRIYLNYDFNENLTFKAGWAQAFKAPNLRQLNPNWVQTSRGRGCGAVGGPCEMVGNPDLKPETSNSFELGGVYQSDKWDASLTYFYNEIDDKITSARQASLITGDGTKYVQQINIDRARTQGFEGGLTVYPLPDWTWNNSFTYLIESKNLETGMPLSADPEYSIHSEVTWQARENLSVTGSVDYYGKQVDYVISPETLVAQNVKPYAVANASFKYDPTKHFSLRVGVNNLFDTQPKSESNYVENGRSYFVSLTSKF
ncbi:TonB-dependent receptor domain-containing protein [Brucella gallinifaecis]|uniref:TonB-dependent receptor domain-containing protein n=1 Tax=Brucella gallinifaecis TaxID=215590 RepID=UPI002362B6FD|nr:TonB-dependent receptor [Brucella gallinifaecis]